jgi:molecular chaperone GrpE
LPLRLLEIPSSSHNTYHTMFQRTILRASRQQAARQIRPFAPLRQQVGITRATATPAIRWYSDAAPAKEGEAAEKKEEVPAAKDESAQLKEQMEKKDKEIVELKVRQQDAQQLQ